MPTNTPIATVSTGTVGTAAWANSVANLNTATGLFAVAGVWSGSPPPTNAPNFYFQAGTFTASSDSNAHINVTFSAFPNGLVWVLAWQGDITYLNGNLIADPTNGISTSNMYFYFVDTTTGAGITSSSSIHVNYLALGF